MDYLTPSNNFVFPSSGLATAPTTTFPLTNNNSSQFLSSSASTTTSGSGSGESTTVSQPNILFVGNLSYFCEERHLFELFNQYGPVEKTVIIHNEQQIKSLLFGFVTMKSAHAAQELQRLMDGHMFMGRRMK